MNPTVTIDGAQRRIVLDSDEFRCPTTSSATPPSDQPTIRGGVHTESGAAGDNTVTVVIYPPAGTTDTDALTTVTTSIAEHLRGMLTAVVSRPMQPVHVEPRLGTDGESCRTKADCDGPLTCERAMCVGEPQAHSAQLIATTGKVAKWGAILLIPPICAVGALVLLQCLFMVIVAGCMYAGGD